MRQIFRKSKITGYSFPQGGWNIPTRAVMRSYLRNCISVCARVRMDSLTLLIYVWHWGEKMAGTRCTRKEDVDRYIFRREMVE